MQDREVVTDRSGSDEAINRRSKGHSSPACSSIESNGLLDEACAHRRFDDGQGEHGVACGAECPLVPPTLQNFLDDGQVFRQAPQRRQANDSA